MLFREHPKLWPNLEAVRKAVAYRRGRMGVLHRGRRAGAANTYASTCPSVPWNPQGYLPASEERAFTPHRIAPSGDERALILSDIHIPYHSLSALTAALEVGRKDEVSIIILNGDTLDFYKLSRFSKDPRKRDAKEEIKRANQFLDVLDEQFPKARKVWKDGNHDERYGHYLCACAPELFSVLAEHASLDQLLELHDRGWEYVTDKRPIYLGKLPVIHGHEYPTPVLGPVNAARGLFLRAKDCAMVGHHHQTSEHTETSIREQMITTWSTGCLCELHPEYARFNKWNHGAARVDLDGKGNFSVRNFRIHEGRVLN
jgi:predicted phosphodiesterase